MMKAFLFATIALLLSACGLAGQFGLTPASAPGILAVAGETRAAANCIRDEDAGRPPSRVTTIRIRGARRVMNMTAGPMMSEAAKAEVQGSRDDTDLVCPPLRGAVNLTPPPIEAGPIPESPNSP